MATLDLAEIMLRNINEGIRDGIKSKLMGYNSPLEKMMTDCINEHGTAIKSLLSDAIAESVKDESFRLEIQTSLRSQLAKTLVQRFGGELEKQVNALKSDPTTRARITIAIEDIVRSSNT